jgi:prefoldin subunit 5
MNKDPAIHTFKKEILCAIIEGQNNAINQLHTEIQQLKEEIQQLKIERNKNYYLDSNE